MTILVAQNEKVFQDMCKVRGLDPVGTRWVRHPRQLTGAGVPAEDIIFPAGFTGTDIIDQYNNGNDKIVEWADAVQRCDDDYYKRPIQKFRREERRLKRGRPPVRKEDRQ